MAKKKTTGVNKTQAIRDYKVNNPSAKPKEISEELNKQGVSVTPGYVSTILSTSKKKGKVGTGRRGRPKGSKNVPAVRAIGTATQASGRSSKLGGGEEVSVDALLKMKTLVSQVGGIDEAKSALATLEKLID